MFDVFNLKGKLICEGRTYNPCELQKIVQKIERKIIDNLNKAENIVAIALPRNEYFIATIWALLDIKIAFLPLDLSLPKERLLQMLQIAEIDTIITVSGATELEMDVSSIYLDNLTCEEEKECEYITENQNAYVLFTSGTTGIPKAVMVTYKGFKNFMDGIPKKVPIGDDTVIGCFTNVMFDIFFLEAILPLLYGGTVVLANNAECNNPKSISKLIKDFAINTLQMTPSRYRMLAYLDTELAFMKNIKVLMLGGEAVSYDIVEAVRKKSNTEIYNMYGPTETTIWSTVSNLTEKNQIDIGTPIQNTRIYILDETFRKVSSGEVGEICIGGDGLAIGYKNNYEHTKKVFIEGSGDISERIYCTGDMGYVDEEGNYYCLGRKDNQIKIRGHRVELEDIEVNVKKHFPETDVVVCWKNEKLIMFYIAKETIEKHKFYDVLSEFIPEYMIPTEYYKVNSFIYTQSGKMDRKRMIKELIYEAETNGINEETTDMDDISETICDILVSLMGITHGMFDEATNLKELGIDSIKFVNMVVELEDIYDMEFDDDKMTVAAFDNVKAVADYIRSNKL